MDCKKCKIIGHLDLTKTYLVQVGDDNALPTMRDIHGVKEQLRDEGVKSVCVGPHVHFIEPKEMKKKKKK